MSAANVLVTSVTVLFRNFETTSVDTNAIGNIKKYIFLIRNLRLDFGRKTVPTNFVENYFKICD